MRFTEFSILILLLFGSCQHSAPGNRVVVLQPLGDFNGADAGSLAKQLKNIFSHVVIKEGRTLPTTAYYAPRKRYRADSLLRWLINQGSSDTVILGLTTQDISTTKGEVRDWGIMGLANRPGKACIISSYRLSASHIPDQLYKVAVHELGHTQGLPHCLNKSCYMRDAAGSNPLDEEEGFCNNCRHFLVGKGWKL